MNPALIALSIGVMVVGAIVLFFAITRMLTLLRTSEIASLPVVPEAQVTFQAPGTYVLHVDQPRLSFALTHAEYALWDTMGGDEVRSSPVIFRTTASGVSTARVSVRYLDIPRAGVYRLAVTGVDPASDVSRSKLVFTRPFGASLFLLILANVFGGACAIGGLVFAALLYTGKR